MGAGWEQGGRWLFEFISLLLNLILDLTRDGKQSSHVIVHEM